ncbi:hypothetical protein AA101099_0726 [Neoasaia chiangmaiensis NBRC 101099]|uniref:Uncharacterized protein n=1 Tax=Neoasaia chiangmaiensis TaxID=320497 RepID=A0A1U9KM57_9PROT|nr:hypothetical protein [Neoasaia chiangmaiensis]AQS86873.1 hypothetical protein A0U93_01700 [Neoasaia chiangmaiensis]GBR37448.1 hypothetical protein AA101099_0726 [Neoasaia chiangmaiensis NBRC 101099]GEN14957.1 hypothetical protein NCH01_13880 [Neoasaia chiangmaiensis]
MWMRFLGYGLILGCWLAVGGTTFSWQQSAQYAPFSLFFVWLGLWIAVASWLMWEMLPSNIDA